MSIRSLLISTALAFTTAACSTGPKLNKKEDEAKRIADMIPVITITDPKTGCRYLEPQKGDTKPPTCIISDFPLK